VLLTVAHGCSPGRCLEPQGTGERVLILSWKYHNLDKVMASALRLGSYLRRTTIRLGNKLHRLRGFRDWLVTVGCCTKDSRRLQDTVDWTASSRGHPKRPNVDARASVQMWSQHQDLFLYSRSLKP